MLLQQEDFCRFRPFTMRPVSMALFSKLIPQNPALVSLDQQATQVGLFRRGNLRGHDSIQFFEKNRENCQTIIFFLSDVSESVFFAPYKSVGRLNYFLFLIIL